MKLSAFVACTILILSAAALVKSDYAKVTAEQSLLKYLMLPGAISDAADPAATAACFTQYLPILTQVGSTFSQDYQACITLAQQQITTLTNAAEGNRTAFIKTTTDLCSNYTACNGDTEILNFFYCYASASQVDVSVVYDLQTNATTAAATLSAGIKLVQEEESTCTNTTEETYVKSTASTYRLLDACLAAAGSPTLAPVTDVPSNTNVENAYDAQNDCSDNTSSGTRTQTNADATQTQSQTGAGCQTQRADNGAQSQSQSGSGRQTQSQCSGSDCGEFKPFAPMKPMQPMAPMPAMN